MIKKYVNSYTNSIFQLAQLFTERCPNSYPELFKTVIEHVCPDLNHERITVIDDGDYQGVLLFLVPKNTYQPEDYYYVKIDYGSCSACDTLEAIQETYNEDKELAVKDLLTLSLHIIQRLKKLT